MILLFFAAFHACKEKEIYPVIPSIEFKSHYFMRDPNSIGVGNDTLLAIVFSYKDGDGDIGLNEGDTFPPYDTKPDSFLRITNPYFYNIHIEYLEKHGNEYKPFIIPNTTDTFKVLARVSSLTPEGKFKAIRGEIDYRFLPPLFPERKDSIKVRIKLYDRALNQSNIAESPMILLP
jgi:hypothetical protein